MPLSYPVKPHDGIVGTGVALVVIETKSGAALVKLLLDGTKDDAELDDKG